MRSYEPIWNKLKKDKSVEVIAPRHLHARIIKAVKKEKWMDVVWKLCIAPEEYMLYSDRSGTTVRFILKATFSKDRLACIEEEL
jgi:hypothetical protein